MNSENIQTRRKVFTFTDNGAFPSIIFSKKEELELWERGVVVDENSPLVDHWRKKYVEMKEWKLVPDLISNTEIKELKKRKRLKGIIPIWLIYLVCINASLSILNIIFNDNITRSYLWLMSLIEK